MAIDKTQVQLIKNKLKWTANTRYFIGSPFVANDLNRTSGKIRMEVEQGPKDNGIKYVYVGHINDRVITNALLSVMMLNPVRWKDDMEIVKQGIFHFAKAQVVDYHAEPIQEELRKFMGRTAMKNGQWVGQISGSVPITNPIKNGKFTVGGHYGALRALSNMVKIACQQNVRDFQKNSEYKDGVVNAMKQYFPKEIKPELIGYTLDMDPGAPLDLFNEYRFIANAAYKKKYGNGGK
jgi:hypothetical protein